MQQLRPLPRRGGPGHQGPSPHPEAGRLAALQRAHDRGRLTELGDRPALPGTVALLQRAAPQPPMGAAVPDDGCGRATLPRHLPGGPDDLGVPRRPANRDHGASATSQSGSSQRGTGPVPPPTTKAATGAASASRLSMLIRVASGQVPDSGAAATSTTTTPTSGTTGRRWSSRTGGGSCIRPWSQQAGHTSATPSRAPSATVGAPTRTAPWSGVLRPQPKEAAPSRCSSNRRPSPCGSRWQQPQPQGLTLRRGPARRRWPQPPRRHGQHLRLRWRPQPPRWHQPRPRQWRQQRRLSPRARWRRRSHRASTKRRQPPHRRTHLSARARRRRHHRRHQPWGQPQRPPGRRLRQRPCWQHSCSRARRTRQCRNWYLDHTCRNRCWTMWRCTRRRQARSSTPNVRADGG